MRKELLILLFASLSAAASSQAPDVAVKVDFLPTYHISKNQESTFRWFDSLGRYSTVGLSASLEPGYRAFVSERLQKIDRNADPEQLDEYYIEDPGIWRLGKQYLPFGRRNLIRESVRAARGDTRLLVERFPISLAICDNGRGQARGFVGHLGSMIGFSFAIGENFGGQSTSLTLVRRPEEGPGKGRGYRQIFGADFSRHFKIYTVQAEAIVMRRGYTALDPNTEVSDLAVSVQANRFNAVTLGWSREWGKNDDFVRLQGRMLVATQSWLEPIVRMKNGEFYDFGVTLRVSF